MTEETNKHHEKHKPPEKEESLLRKIWNTIKKIAHRTKSKISKLLGWDEQDAVKPNPYVDRLDAQTPEIEKVCEESVVREKLIPSKKVILENIVNYALTQKFKLESMKMHRIFYDKAGNVVVLEVSVANEDGGNTLISYIVEGRHSPSEEGKLTAIQWGWTSGADFTKMESGGPVFDYKGGKWIAAY